MFLQKISKYLAFFDYYCYTYFQRRLGKGLMDMNTNGELYIALNEIAQYEQPVVFDVGANVGNFTAKIVFHCKQATLHCFEPDTQCMQKLQSRFSDNQNIILFKGAISNHSGTVTLFGTPDGTLTASSSIYPHYYLANQANTEFVPMITLDEYTKTHAIEHIHYIKVDVEGAEVPLLRGATRLLADQKIDFIQLEYNQTWLKSHSTFEDIWEICEQYGYKLYRILPHALMRIDFYHYILDDFFYQNLLMVANRIAPHSKIKKNKIPTILQQHNNNASS